MIHPDSSIFWIHPFCFSLISRSKPLALQQNDLGGGGNHRVIHQSPPFGTSVSFLPLIANPKNFGSHLAIDLQTIWRFNPWLEPIDMNSRLFFLVSKPKKECPMYIKVYRLGLGYILGCYLHQRTSSDQDYP